jgi:hypothetical protein
LDITICASIVVAILGIAYPILLQIISSLDEKYSSNKISELFNKEPSKKWFIWLLGISIVFIFIWSLKWSPASFLPQNCYLINNSADILVFVSSSGLVLVFFWFVNSVFVYYTPTDLIGQFVKAFQKKNGEIIYFNALGSIFLQAIRKQDDIIIKTISRFFYDAFQRIRKKNTENEAVEYPDDYYNLVHRTIEELIFLQNRKVPHLEYRAAGGIWLIGELKNSIISDRTYNWLWRNLVLEVENERDDLVLNHWSNAHQHRDLNLSYYEGALRIKDPEKYDRREREVTRFTEFHYVLGGLLLYRERHKCIARIFKFTKSEPPRYVLLANSMHEIFNWYVKFYDPYDRHYPWISTIYWFPDLDGLNADGVVKKWVCSYLALLFLRLYGFSVHSYGDPLQLPQSPKLQSDKKLWMESLPFFKRLLMDLLDNRSLLNELNLKHITREWCEENDKLFPMDLIDQLENNLKQQYNLTAVSIDVSKDKEQDFLSSSKKIMKDGISELMLLNNTEVIESNYKDISVGGCKIIERKDAFTENPEMHHMNYDSILGEITIKKLKEVVAKSFLNNSGYNYVLKPEEIFEGINRLKLNPKEHIIISYGFNFDYYKEQLKVAGINDKDYKGISIVSFNNTDSVNRSLFILNKKDLPKFIFEDIEEEDKKKYKLKEIISDYHIHASVSDFNKVSQELRDEHSSPGDQKEIMKSVLLIIIFLLQIRWKANVKVVHLTAYYEYEQRGLPNNLNDISKF